MSPSDVTHILHGAQERLAAEAGITLDPQPSQQQQLPRTTVANPVQSNILDMAWLYDQLSLNSVSSSHVQDQC